MWSPLFPSEPIPAQALYQGRLFVQPALPEDPFLEALVEDISGQFGLTPDTLRHLHETRTPDMVWSHLQTIRAQWKTPEFLAFFARYLAYRFDLGPAPGTPGARYRMSNPCLRACLPHGHQNPKAAPAYFLHRDTWYDLPGCAVNLWMPLHAVTRSETFVLYPACFDRKVPNDSAGFSRKTWEGNPEKAHYPTAALPEDSGKAVGVSGEVGDVLLFSAQHLHQTCLHEGELTRLSLDVRLIDIEDEKNGIGAPTEDTAR